MRTRAIEDELRRLTDEVAELRHKTELMERVFIVKEPDTVRAADAYDGLRRQVIASTGERRAHLARIVEMAVAVRRGADLKDIEARVAEWEAQAGIVEVYDPRTVRDRTFDDLFEVLAEGPGDLVVTEPAYVDEATGATLRKGRAAYVREPEPRRELRADPLVEDVSVDASPVGSADPDGQQERNDGP